MYVFILEQPIYVVANCPRFATPMWRCDQHQHLVEATAGEQGLNSYQKQGFIFFFLKMTLNVQANSEINTPKMHMYELFQGR